MRRTLQALMASLVAVTGTAHASDGELAPDLSVHGFVSPGYILTTHGNNYLADSSGAGSVEFLEAGLNFTAQLGDRLRAGFQLFARDRGPLGNYDVKLDWAYLDYRFQDWFGLRAGRVKIPFGLYNETSDIDPARVPVLLPQSIYPIDNRDFLLAQTGGEIYGHVPLEAGGALQYRLYAGTILLDTPTSDPASGVSLLELSVPYLVGARLMWETPLLGLRLGGSVQTGRIDARLRATVPAPIDIDVSIDGLLWVASIEYALGDMLIAAEYSRWHIESRADQPLFPSSDRISERTYLMFSYRVCPWFHPGLYYSLYFRDVDDRTGREMRQHDVAVTLRFDVEEHWLVKLEAHYLDGTAELDSDLNGGRPQSEMAPRWAMFLLKTTAYF